MLMLNWNCFVFYVVLPLLLKRREKHIYMYIFLLYLCCLPQKSLKNITFEKDKENICIYKLHKKKKLKKLSIHKSLFQKLNNNTIKQPLYIPQEEMLAQRLR